jgi:hypothetical protein
MEGTDTNGLNPDLTATITGEGLLADLKQRIRVAAEVAQGAGEFKELAFAKTLDFLFSETIRGRSGGPTFGDVSNDGPAGKRRTNGGSPRRVARLDLNQLDRIRPILDSPPEISSEYASTLAGLQNRYVVYAALDFAGEKFGIPRLTVGEIREILRRTFRVGMPDGTLRGILSKAPPADVGRTASEGGETDYQLMQAGKAALKSALDRNSADKKRE